MSKEGCSRYIEKIPGGEVFLWKQVVRSQLNSIDAIVGEMGYRPRPSTQSNQDIIGTLETATQLVQRGGVLPYQAIDSSQEIGTLKFSFSNDREEGITYCHYIQPIGGHVYHVGYFKRSNIDGRVEDGCTYDINVSPLGLQVHVMYHFPLVWKHNPKLTHPHDFNKLSQVLGLISEQLK